MFVGINERWAFSWWCLWVLTSGPPPQARMRLRLTFSNLHTASTVTTALFIMLNNILVSCMEETSQVKRRGLCVPNLLDSRSQLLCGLRPLAGWDFGFESRRDEWMSVWYECCVLSGRGLCNGLITRPEHSYRAWCIWVWSRNLNSEEA